MKAIVQDHYGSTDVLELGDIDRPAIADDQVRVRVHAAGVDRGVWHLMTGLPYPIRVAGYGLRAPKSATLGRELAGVVDAVGDRVTAFAPGDEVFGIGEGAYAAYAVAAEAKLALKPATLTFEQAACLGVSALTALQAVRDHGGVQPGHKVLVVGASGGVGSFAVQIAKAYGAEVTGVCSTSKVDLVRSLGADHVIDYTLADFADGRGGYDVVIDIGGNASLTRLRRALSRTGTLVIVGGETGGRVLGGFERGLRAMALSPFIAPTLKTMVCSENSRDLVALAGLAESGQVTPAIERAYPLAQVPDAIRHMADGRARGKVVISL
ncbi:MAG: NAD(P)-dependent alcohol dehydrogenase [Actinomycetota bacterium]|nr:NAD(P)-dependent alcohol dehydrogenase [Actinomycetota bacterium]